MSQPNVVRAAVVGICGVVVALGLLGCRESEEGRVVFFKKGEYAGKPDKQLSAAQLNALRSRTASQQE